MKTRMDPPRVDGWARCLHDMYVGTCSICRGLPDVPDLDVTGPALDLTRRLEQDDTPRVYPAERSGRCVRCHRAYRIDARLVWSAEDSGALGPCCAGDL